MTASVIEGGGEGGGGRDNERQVSSGVGCTKGRREKSPRGGYVPLGASSPEDVK